MRVPELTATRLYLEAMEEVLPRMQKTLVEAGIREATGCNVLAVSRGGEIAPTTERDRPLDPGCDLVLIGDPESEAAFFRRYQA